MQSASRKASLRYVLYIHASLIYLTYFTHKFNKINLENITMHKE